KYTPSPHERARTPHVWTRLRRWGRCDDVVTTRLATETAVDRHDFPTVRAPFDENRRCQRRICAPLRRSAERTASKTGRRAVGPRRFIRPRQPLPDRVVRWAKTTGRYRPSARKRPGRVAL